MSLGVGLSLGGNRILVVGGAGFVGSNLVRMILAGSPRVRITVVDNLLSSERISVSRDKRVDFIRGSIADDAVISRIGDRYAFVFHLATYHGNQSSIHDPLRDHANNTLTTLKLMNRLRGYRKIRKMVYSSAGCSCAVKTFGRPRATTEDAPISLVQDSPYSISKIIGEFYSLYFFRQYGLPVVRARFQNVYGPGEILGAGKWRGTPATVWRNVTPTFVYKALKGRPLPLENGGRATRDFIFVDDICRGLIACALRGRPGEVYNLASGRETTIRKLADAINGITANKAGFLRLPRRPWDHSGRRFGSTEKAARMLGFRAVTGLREGIERTVAWTRENLPLIERCMRKHDKYMR